MVSLNYLIYIYINGLPFWARSMMMYVLVKIHVQSAKIRFYRFSGKVFLTKPMQFFVNLQPSCRNLRLRLEFCNLNFMRKLLMLFLFISAFGAVSAQKVESIYFNLYTDSLKKGFYNYINVDGKFSDGKWLPLTEKDITLTSNGGTFKGNDLFIDSSYKGETVTVKAVLKSDPQIWKEVTIYIRKRGFDPLKTENEILETMKGKKKKG